MLLWLLYSFFVLYSFSNLNCSQFQSLFIQPLCITSKTKSLLEPKRNSRKNLCWFGLIKYMNTYIYIYPLNFLHDYPTSLQGNKKIIRSEYFINIHTLSYRKENFSCFFFEFCCAKSNVHMFEESSH